MSKKLSRDYITGLVESEGSFTFSTWRKIKKKVPAFQLKMSIRDAALVGLVKESMGLDNNVYIYNHQGKDGHTRKAQALLLVREIGNLKNIVVPFFYDQFKGDKRFQFEDWLNCIGTDLWVPDTYRVIYRLHKNGYYSKNRKF